ncbi:Pr6Pr family membrane protein [Kribbella sp. HUAS MG21]|uniref:Pr6Pr family membrane protein n=1 Tax=Kribbella sp. HUAS MG21 TaxID=3160966 RepID=A0AAU7TIX8_9ACTN
MRRGAVRAVVRRPENGEGWRERTRGLVVSRWWHGLIAAVILVALVIQLVLLFTGGADANSGESGTAVGVGTRLWRLFSFFTIQSNLIVLAVAVGLVLRPGRDVSAWNVVRLDVTYAFAWPLAWLSYIFTQGTFTDWYPYPFLDVTDLGLPTALRNATFVLVLGLALAAALKTLDTKLPPRP